MSINAGSISLSLPGAGVAHSHGEATHGERTKVQEGHGGDRGLSAPSSDPHLHREGAAGGVTADPPLGIGDETSSTGRTRLDTEPEP